MEKTYEKINEGRFKEIVTPEPKETELVVEDLKIERERLLAEKQAAIESFDAKIAHVDACLAKGVEIEVAEAVTALEEINEK